MALTYPNTLQEILKTKKNLLITDGASRGNPGPSGWAFILLSGEKNYVKELSGYSAHDTNGRMEMFALLQGIKAFHDVNLKAAPIILSDSKFVIDGTLTWRMSWRRNGWMKSDGTPVLHTDLWKEIDAFVDILRPQFAYVEAHKGHPGNSRCDEIAVAAATQAPIPLYEGNLDAYTAFSKITYESVYDEPRYLCWKGSLKTVFTKWPEAQEFMKQNPGYKSKKIFSAEEAEAVGKV